MPDACRSGAAEAMLVRPSALTQVSRNRLEVLGSKSQISTYLFLSSIRTI